MISSLGQHSGHVVAAFLSGRLIVLVLVGAAAILILLAAPVLGEMLLNSLSAGATRAAPRALVLGLGVLLAGLVTGVGILDVVGGCLIGAILIGAIMSSY